MTSIGMTRGQLDSTSVDHETGTKQIALFLPTAVRGGSR